MPMTRLIQKMTVVKVINSEDLSKAYSIRFEVFVVEQKVAIDLEFDEYEETSHHYLALSEKGEAIGTARWRVTQKGIKLERFAVLKSFRKKGVGYSLVKKVLQDIKNQKSTDKNLIYLHSQIDAMPLYKQFGFEEIGNTFEECGILHKEMILSS